MSDEILICNAGDGPVIAGGRILYPGEMRLLPAGIVDALRLQYGPDVIVAAGEEAAAPAAKAEETPPAEDAPPEAEAEDAPAASGKKAKK